MAYRRNGTAAAATETATAEWFFQILCCYMKEPFKIYIKRMYIIWRRADATDVIQKYQFVEISVRGEFLLHYAAMPLTGTNTALLTGQYLSGLSSPVTSKYISVVLAISVMLMYNVYTHLVFKWVDNVKSKDISACVTRQGNRKC